MDESPSPSALLEQIKLLVTDVEAGGQVADAPIGSLKDSLERFVAGYGRLVGVVEGLSDQLIRLNAVVEGHSDELTELTRQMNQVAEILARE